VSIGLFRRTLDRRGVARIGLEVVIPSGEEIAVRFHGRFVAFDQRRYPQAGPA